MVFIIAASSLDHALETLTLGEKARYNDKVFSIPGGLSLNKNTRKPKQNVQNLLSKDLKEKKNIVIWHDVLNNSISHHDSNNFQALNVSQMIDELKAIQDKLCALVYFQRYRTPYIFDALNEMETDYNIEVFSIVKVFISTKKQKDPELWKKYKALHQSPELELKNLEFILRNESQLSPITDKSRPKRLSKRARNAIKKASLNPSYGTPPPPSFNLSVVETVSKLRCLVDISLPPIVFRVVSTLNCQVDTLKLRPRPSLSGWCPDVIIRLKSWQYSTLNNPSH